MYKKIRESTQIPYTGAYNEKNEKVKVSIFDTSPASASLSTRLIPEDHVKPDCWYHVARPELGALSMFVTFV